MTALPVVPLKQANTVRLIPSGRLKPPVLAPLADTDDELNEIAEIDDATNDRLVGALHLPPGLAPDELVGPSYGWGHTYINNAFIKTRSTGNRFNGPERGAWYAAFDVETALEEVAYHLTAELEAIGHFDNTTDYGELLADFIGDFHDTRGLNPTPNWLNPGREIGYPAGQQLAAELRATGSRGLIYPSVRRPGGDCIAAFLPNVVQNLRQGGMWRLVWQGTPVPEKTRIVE